MAREILEDRLLTEKPLHPAFREARSRRATTRSPHPRSRSLGRDIEETQMYKKIQEIDLAPIKMDAQTDVNMRKKLGGDAVAMDRPEGGALVRDVVEKVAAEFTKRELTGKVRMVLNEVLRCWHHLSVSPAQKPSKWQLHVYPSEIFSASSCVEAVATILSVLATGLESIIPFADLCHTVLHLPHGLWIVDRILFHNHKRILNVYERLMDVVSGEDLDDPASVFYGKVLLHLARHFPSSASHLHYMAVGRRAFFVLILSLTLDKGRRPPPSSSVIQHTHDALAPRFVLEEAVALLLYQMLVAPKGNNRQWALKCTGSAAAKQNPQFTECRIQLLLHGHKLLPEQPGPLPAPAVQAACRLLQLYAQLKEGAGLPLSSDEYRILAKLCSARVRPSASGNHLLILSLCCLTAFPELLGERSGELETVEWIRWLLELDLTGLGSQGGGTCLEVLLLIVSHLRAGEYKEISEVVSGYLLTKVTIKPQMVVRLKLLLNAEVFKEDTLLRYSLRIPPTEKLNAAVEHALPVHCIYNILHNKTYSSYNISVKEWIMRQMVQCWLPIHPMMMQLLRTLVQSSLPVLRRISDGPDDYAAPQQPLTAAEVLGLIYDRPSAELATSAARRRLRTAELFARPEEASDPYKNVPKILMAFYVLLYKDFYLNNLKTFMMARNVDCRMYELEVLERIPFKHYLALTARHQELFDPLGDALGRLMLQHLPHMRTSDDQVTGRESATPRHTLHCQPNLPSLPAENEDLTRFLDVLTRYPADQLATRLEDFLRLLPRVLQEDLSESSRDAFERVWTHLVDMDPNTVLLATTVAFLQHKDKAVAAITFEELCFEPLHVLRCDPVVFRKAFLTRILLRTFSAFLTASRGYLQQQLEVIDQQQMLLAGVEAVEPTREERKRAMFMLQESAAVQLLIEQCRPDGRPEAEELQLPVRLDECRNAVCVFIHQMIIANPTLAKLIIFQGFPMACIPVMVRGVESLHICLDFVHEAMALPSLEKKLFILELTACLCVKFRIGRALAVARLAVDVLATLLTAYPAATRRQVARVGARVLGRLGNVFPPLREECLGLLEQMAAGDKAGATAGRAWMGAGRRLLRGGGEEKGLGLRGAVECCRGRVALRS